VTVVISLNACKRTSVPSHREKEDRNEACDQEGANSGAGCEDQQKSYENKLVESVKKPTNLHTYFFSRREREQIMYRKRAFTNGRAKARMLRSNSPHPVRPLDFKIRTRSPSTTSPAIIAISPNITKKYWQIAADGTACIQAGSTAGRKFIILEH
jgi:hypothetical protein